MKTGKIPQAVLDRSVLRPLRLSGVLGGDARFGADAFRVRAEEEMHASAGICSHTVCSMTGGRLDPDIVMLLSEGVNSLAAAGIAADSAALALLLPAHMPEQELAALTGRIREGAAAFQLTIAGGHSEVAAGIDRPAVTVTTFGSRGIAGGCGDRSGRVRSEDREDKAYLRGGLRAGRTDPETVRLSAAADDRRGGSDGELSLVMAGTAGQAGTAVLARAYEQKLRRRFPGSIVDEALSFGEAGRLSVVRAAGIAAGYQAVMHDVSRGGVLGALWELAEREKIGFEAELGRIPLRQESVEICEALEGWPNVYRLYGQGALLMIARQGQALCRELEAAGYAADVIGRVNAGPSRILRSGGEIRFLERPLQDALHEHEMQRGPEFPLH